MDGDGTNDFDLSYFNGGGSITGSPGNGIFVIDEVDYATRRYDLGAAIGLAGTNAETASWTNLIGQGFSYVGVKFLAGGKPTWGGFNSSSRMPLAAGWRAAPGNISPVKSFPPAGWPEPRRPRTGRSRAGTA